MNKLTYLLLLISLVSCDYFKQDEQQIPVARVNDSYIYTADIQDLITENTSIADSALIVSNYINRWATQQLLIDQAKINLSQETQDAYNTLVRDYKNDLFTEAYKSVIVTKQLDSTVSQTELEDYYELNKVNFRLNELLIKVRYIYVDKNFTDLKQTEEKFIRFNEEDKNELTEAGIMFKSYNLNDSVWVKQEALIKALPVLKDKTAQVLKKSNFTQLQDSLGLYLVKIQDVLKTNDIAPLSHIKPTIRQIILNRRKLKLIKNLEKDITKDAIKNNNFEIYKNN
ncbi:MAG: hypothetical protein ACI86C_001626 [Candidatus Latescibacterota bacterium]|jgi:hypothetical protein